ncbi:hypothetical protein PCE1_004698 [Barthelona sp. PCE]
MTELHTTLIKFLHKNSQVKEQEEGTSNNVSASDYTAPVNSAQGLFTPLGPPMGSVSSPRSSMTDKSASKSFLWMVDDILQSESFRNMTSEDELVWIESLVIKANEGDREAYDVLYSIFVDQQEERQKKKKKHRRLKRSSIRRVLETAGNHGRSVIGYLSTQLWYRTEHEAPSTLLLLETHHAHLKLLFIAFPDSDFSQIQVFHGGSSLTPIEVNVVHMGYPAKSANCIRFLEGDYAELEKEETKLKVAAFEARFVVDSTTKHLILAFPDDSRLAGLNVMALNDDSVTGFTPVPDVILSVEPTAVESPQPLSAVEEPAVNDEAEEIKMRAVNDAAKQQDEIRMLNEMIKEVVKTPVKKNETKTAEVQATQKTSVSHTQHCTVMVNAEVQNVAETQDVGVQADFTPLVIGSGIAYVYPVGNSLKAVDSPKITTCVAPVTPSRMTPILDSPLPKAKFVTDPIIDDDDIVTKRITFSDEVIVFDENDDVLDMDGMSTPPKLSPEPTVCLELDTPPRKIQKVGVRHSDVIYYHVSTFFNSIYRSVCREISDMVEKTEQLVEWDEDEKYALRVTLAIDDYLSKTANSLVQNAVINAQAQQSPV